MTTRTLRGILPFALVVSTALSVLSSEAAAQSGALARPSIVHHVRSASERQELTVNTSRILTLDNKIPQAQRVAPDAGPAVATGDTQIPHAGAIELQELREPEGMQAGNHARVAIGTGHFAREQGGVPAILLHC